MSKLKEIREKRAKAHADAVVLLQGEQTVETRQKADAFLAEVETLTQDIARIERADALAGSVATAAAGADNVDPKETAKQYRGAFMEHLRKGAKNVRTSVKGGAADSSMALLESVKNQMGRVFSNEEQRDQLAGTQSIAYTEGTVGGFFVPAGFVYDVDVATKFYAPLLDGKTIRILETATGQTLPYPTSNDTNNAWTLVGEATQVVDSGLSPNYPNTSAPPSANPGNVGLGHVNFNAYKGTTGLIRVSLELLQDSAFNIEAFLTEAFAVRLGRGYEYYLTNGSGSNAPTGILPAIAASGAVPVTAIGSATNDGSANTGANSIGSTDIINLIHSVDPSYRNNAKFMFHDQTLRFLRTLLDKFGRPLWVPSVRDGEPDRISGYEYVINQAFPQIAASATTIAFGAWQKFIARKVRDLQVLRLDERFADYGEVAYVGFSRIDSNLVDAGTHPLNVLAQHS